MSAHRPLPYPVPADVDSAEVERRFPRRLLLTGGLTAAAVGVVEAASPVRADAAAGTTAWQLGGNSGVATNGTNFLGPTTAGAPLIVKTTGVGASSPSERLRVTPDGKLGVNLMSPVAKVDVSSSLNPVIRATSTSTSSSDYAILGTAKTANGVHGVSTDGKGVVGESTNGYGVDGSGYIGVYGNGGTYGLYGQGGSYGVYGYSSYYGVYGYGGTDGVYANGGTDGVYAYGGVNGVQGKGQIGVSATGSVHGVYGETTSVGSSAGSTVGGLFRAQVAANTFAVYADGNMNVTGTLSKSAGSFKIDHPLDPEHKWLSHSFVESPDMMNVYNGTVVLDEQGKATIELPDYFAALNRDYRYQLTPIGAAAPDLHVAAEVKDNEFAVAGGKAGLTVSWQVTGIRQDAYAKKHPIVVEQAKTGNERGALQFVPPGSKAKAMVGPQTLAPASAAPPSAHEPLARRPR